MIELRNVHVVFNRGTQLEHPVLRGLNLKVAPGEFLTIIGGNGAGKSTLLNVLAGEVIPSGGQVLIDGQDVTTLSPEKRSPMVARVFQDPNLSTFADLTVAENLSIAHNRGQGKRFGFALRREQRSQFRQALEPLNMGLENRLHDPVALLSGGQRQALSLVMATLQKAKIILLDEHTAALDPKTAARILELTNMMVTTHSLTALMITHSMSQALQCGQHTILLHGGTIARDMQGPERKSFSPQDLVQFFDL